MTSESNIITTSKRTTVQVTLPDGRTLEGPAGTTIEAFLRAAGIRAEPPIVAAILGKDLHELSYPVNADGNLVLLDTGTGDGSRIYRRSLVFLLVVAVRELFPGSDVTVDHSVSDGGFFCSAYRRAPFSAEEMQRIETRMREIAHADEPISRREVPLAEAIRIFERDGYQDKVRLMKVRRKDYLTIYSLRGYRGLLPRVHAALDRIPEKIPPAPDGIGIHPAVPETAHALRKSLPNGDYPKLWATFQEYGHWQERLGLEDVGMLNEAIEGGRGREVILVAEALHDQKTAEIARRIADDRDRIRLVLIAGPSSSGKTTFSRRLSIQLLSQGLRPYPVEMDNYFVDRDKTPVDESGAPDFEAFEALDRDLLNDNLERLLRGEEVALPRFDFQSGKRTAGDTVRLPPKAVIIMEGIHGLNPALLPRFQSGEVFRIYASALTQLNLDRHNRISTTDTRLIRRIVRDATQRGHSPASTIAMWDRVRRGERKNIFLYQENSDSIFNSALVYELAALRPIAEPLLRQITPDQPEYIEAKRLLAFLAWFRPLSPGVHSRRFDPARIHRRIDPRTVPGLGGVGMRYVRFRRKGDAVPVLGWLEGDQVGLITGPLFGAHRRMPVSQPLGSVKLAAPWLPGKIVCVGRNYAEHAREHHVDIPDVPMLFMKPPSAVIGPGEQIILPPQSSQVEHEGELAVVIGRRIRNASTEEGLAAVFGYTAANDVTARDLQQRDGQWTRAKGFDTFCPLGPWIDTEVNPHDLRITCRVNGRIRQLGIHARHGFFDRAADLLHLRDHDPRPRGCPADRDSGRRWKAGRGGYGAG